MKPYMVTAGRLGDPRVPERALANCATVDEALNQACTFMAGGMIGVRIANSSGHHVDGQNLEACRKREKRSLEATYRSIRTLAYVIPSPGKSDRYQGTFYNF